MSSYASPFRDRREGRYMKTVSYKDPYEPLSVVIQIDDDDEEGLRNGVHETTEYLELFLRNLLLDEKMNFIIVLCILVECLKKRTLKVQKRTLRAQKRILKIKKRTFEIDYFLFLI